MATPGNGGPAPSPEAQQGQAQLSVLGQYIKDFSFENPNAPRSLAPKDSHPGINIQINVGVGQLAPTDFQVSLKLEGKAESEGMVLFTFDLTFAGPSGDSASGVGMKAVTLPSLALPMRMPVLKPGLRLSFD